MEEKHEFEAINKYLDVLSKELNFSKDKAISILEKYFNEQASDKNLKTESIEDVKCIDCNKDILNYVHPIPYCGVIYNNLCKGIVYNHGLYTQCKKNVSTNFHGYTE